MSTNKGCKHRYLFRGVKKDCGDIVEFAIGYLMPSPNDRYPSSIVDGCFEHDVIEETIGQCTGLKDRNGVLIFEGDIVDLHGDELAVMFWYNRFLMVHEPSCGAEREGECKTDEFQSSYSQNDVEVIGNIH